MTFPSNTAACPDPVNKDNNVAMRLTDDERVEIMAAAKIAWETIETATWKNTKGETPEGCIF